MQILPETAEKTKSNVLDLPKTTILRTLAWLHPDGVFELCAIGVNAPKSNLWTGFATGKKPIVAGWFRDRGKAAALAVQLQATGVYCTLNPCNPALLARGNERLVAGVGRTQDKETQHIRNLLIDIDPARPEGISSSDAEHVCALSMALDIAEDLRAEGWPEPLQGDSGNGAHLIYALDLPNEPGSVALLKSVLEALAARHSENLENYGVQLDLTVCNPARLVRPYGSMNCKGDNIPDRPHRQAKIVSLPATRTPVSVEQLQSLVGTPAADDKPQDGHQGRQAHQAPGTAQTTGILDMAAYLAAHGVEVIGIKPHGDGQLFRLAECPFDASHTNGDAAFYQASNGRPGFKCLHNSCAAYKWRDARRIISGEEKLTAFMPGWTPGGAAAPATTTGYHLSDLGNAERLVAHHGQDLRYCYESNKWWTWTGSRWTKDAPAGAWHLAKRTVKSIYGELAQAAQAAKADADVDLRKAIFRHALTSEKAGRLAGMLLLAQSETGIPVKPADFDANPWLFNCENGTIDLRTGKLLPHDRQDMCTRQAPVAFDSTANCDRFESFLLEIMDGDAEMVAFLQRALGYSLTGDCSEQCLFVPYGHGSNGKSTLLAAVAHVFGDYGLQTPTDTLLTKKNDGIPNDIARLDGPRFVSALEVNQGRRLNESLVKQLVGQDLVSARFLREEFFDFRPQFKLWLGTNHKPIVKDTTHAMWRRLKLIPFVVTIPDAEQDRGLPAKLKAEAPGILAWLVRGCLSWRHGGLSTPGAVTTATNSYRSEQDTLGNFLADCCIVVPGAEALAGDLYAKYMTWCADSGEKHPQTKTAFGLALAERGFEKSRSAAGRAWRGIGINE